MKHSKKDKIVLVTKEEVKTVHILELTSEEAAFLQQLVNCFPYTQTGAEEFLTSLDYAFYNTSYVGTNYSHDKETNLAKLREIAKQANLS